MADSEAVLLLLRGILSIFMLIGVVLELQNVLSQKPTTKEEVVKVWVLQIPDAGYYVLTASGRAYPIEFPSKAAVEAVIGRCAFKYGTVEELEAAHSVPVIQL